MIRLAASLLIVTILSACVRAEQPAKTPAPAPATAPAQTEYRPSMGDLMTMSVQPRHIKIGLGGTARNWTYAAYEAKELNNAFKRIVHTTPIYQDNDIGQAIEVTMRPSLDALDAAIKARDGAGFDKAYIKLTGGCNDCHRALDHAAVMIKIPKVEAFPDQEFVVPPGK